MKRAILFFVCLFGILFTKILAQELPLCKPTTYQDLIEYNRIIAEEFAPTFVQELGEGELKEFDFIRAVDYDGDLIMDNNFNNTFVGSDQPKIYYSVVWTNRSWYITYAIYHTLDYTDPGTIISDVVNGIVILSGGGPQLILLAEMIIGVVQDVLCLGMDEHENDMEGVITQVKRPTATSPAAIMGYGLVCHHNRHVVSPVSSNTFFIEVGTHCISENDYYGFNPCTPSQDGTRLYFPSRILPGESSYELESMFVQGGLWDMRTNTQMFTPDGHLVGNDFGLNAASAPWNWEAYSIIHPINSVMTEPSPSWIEISQFDDTFDQYSSISIAGPDCLEPQSCGLFRPTIHVAKCPVETYIWEVSRNQGPYTFLSPHPTLVHCLDIEIPGIQDIRLTVTTTDGEQFSKVKRIQIEESCSGGGPIIIRSSENSNGAEIQNLEHVSVMPNPFKKQTTIEFGGIIAEAEIEVYEIATGKLIEAVSINNTDQITLDLESVPSGFYLLHIKSKNGFKTIKVLKS